ncbi:MAG TPA: enoyl-CoA hydratase/isomerase family protein [Candidatus Cybelea sp.]|nr:enoyl-CoA hydratase/isomerase family protein [Candidatus Cybelea sp.]
MNRAAAKETDAAGGAPLLSRDGARVTIRLNRPRQHNRLEPDDIAALLRMLAEIDADPEARVLVLTGTGKSFSAGYHIGAIGTPRAKDSADHEISFETLTDRLERLSKPTICALNGGVYGGATDLALACDFRIGVPACEFRMPAARLGVHYYKGGLKRYVSRLGLAAAKRLFLTAVTIDADEMLRIGFLDEIVAADRLAARVDELAELLLELAPLAVQGMKRALNEIARNELDEGALSRAIAATARSEDLKEGVAAWAEKRPPKFRGR